MTLHEFARLLLNMRDCEIDTYAEDNNGQLWDIREGVLKDGHISRIVVTES